MMLSNFNSIKVQLERFDSDSIGSSAHISIP